MVVFKFNPAETGLRKTLREYEEIALRYIWSLAMRAQDLARLGSIQTGS